MFPHSPQSSVPPDKLVQQMIVQALQAFYIEDIETGRYFLQQIRTNLPRFMYQLNPQLRSLCKEIVKLLQDGSLVPDRSGEEAAGSVADTHPGFADTQSEQPQEVQPDRSAPVSSESARAAQPAILEDRVQVAEEFAQMTKGDDQIDVGDMKGEEIDTSQHVEIEPQSESLDTPVVDIPSEDTDPVKGEMPVEFISELSSAVNTVRDKKKKKKDEKLLGSMDELDEFDF
ncbi:MAG: hypothetical protein ACTSQF_00685 [Candidatus Heimdallarchaeaceae archaeon]